MMTFMTLTVERAKQILECGSRLRTAVVGDLMIDVYLRGSATRLSQEAPVPVLRVRDRTKRLGGAANVMRNLTAFGSSAIAFGVVGNDPEGREISAMLDEGKIDRSGIVVDPARRTTEKLRVLAGTQQLVRIDFEDVADVSAEITEQVCGKLAEIIRAHKVDAVIFEDYAKGMLSKELVQKVADLARKNGIYTSLDPHPGHPMEVKGLSLMTPNRSEAFGLAGVYCHPAVSPVEKDSHLQDVAKRLLKSWKTESLLITLGAQGMALFKEGDPVLAIPTHAREVFDVSGAGDTVIAAYTLCKAAGASDLEAATLSNHAAGIVVGKLGTATASPEELFESIAADCVK